MQLTLISQMSNASDAQKIAAKLIPATNGQEWEKMAQDVLSVILKRGSENGMDGAAVRNIMIDVHGKARKILRGTPAESIIFDDSRVGAVIQVLLNQSLFAKADVPAIGQYWPGQGGIYAGLARGQEGEPDYHLILAVEDPETSFTWEDANAHAKTIMADGHKDFALPLRVESALLYANLSDMINAYHWYWTGTEHSAGRAFFKPFIIGPKDGYGVSFEARARFVRRFRY